MAAGAQGSTDDMRILLAEDDATLADAVMRALTQTSHAVDVAADGPGADRNLSAGAYDLAILDIGLPGFDGFEVLRRLRARRSQVPVLMLSLLTLGWFGRYWRNRKWRDGDVSVWPFYSRSEYESALKNPIFLNGAAQPRVRADAREAAVAPQ